jgi:hypothetical protein
VSYVTLILTILGGLISLVTTGSVSAVNALKKENSALKDENADLKAKLAAAEGKTQVVVDDAVAKREKVIAMLKAEIETMEKDQSANPDPAALRDRLNKLLAVP